MASAPTITSARNAANGPTASEPLSAIVDFDHPARIATAATSVPPRLIYGSAGLPAPRAIMASTSSAANAAHVSAMTGRRYPRSASVNQLMTSTSEEVFG